MRLAIWTTCCWLGLLAPLVARDILVSNTAGDDRNTGHEWRNTNDHAGPVRSLKKALMLARLSDRVILANTGQPYRESISLVGSAHSGTPHAPFIVLGSGATLDGSAPTPAHAWEHIRGNVFRFRSGAGGAQQLFLKDRPVPQVPTGTVSAEPPSLEPLHWALVQGDIYFAVEKNKLPADYALSYAARETGVTMYHCDYVALLNLVVQGFRLDGVNLANSARHVQIKAVTARGNGRYGLVVGGACLADIEACTLGNNGRGQLFTQALSETHVRQSDLLPLTAPAWVDAGGLFYWNDKRMQGGLEKFPAAAEPKNGAEKAPEKAADKKE